MYACKSGEDIDMHIADYENLTEMPSLPVRFSGPSLSSVDVPIDIVWGQLCNLSPVVLMDAILVCLKKLRRAYYNRYFYYF